MNPRFSLCFACGLLFSAAMLTGCSQQPGSEPTVEALVVPVSKPVQREVAEYVDYTGRTAGVNSVDIRPRVTGQHGAGAGVPWPRRRDRLSAPGKS